MKKFKIDYIFEIGLFMIPFENFFFAPSNGWATISPIIFFLYIIFNFKSIKIKNFLFFFFIGFLTSLINYFFVGYNLNATISSYIVLILGISSFYSFSIYYEKNKSLSRAIKILTRAYTITLLIGIIQYIGLKFNINAIYTLYDKIAKRNYMSVKRVQFMFTEPSYIGMHVYGILLPLYLITKNKKIFWLILAFVGLSIAFNSGLRIIIDSIIICGIVGLDFIIRNKFNPIILLVIPLGFFLVYNSYTYFYNNNTRFRNIVENGSNGDSSAASRAFRINASIEGYKNNIFHFMFGYGVGNSILAIKDGYNDALIKFKNNYDNEIVELRNSYSDNASLCLYTRLISEYGIFWAILFIFFIIKLYKKSKFKYKLILLLSTAYIYVQFESLGFYSIWLLILILYYTNPNKKDVKICE